MFKDYDEFIEAAYEYFEKYVEEETDLEEVEYLKTYSEKEIIEMFNDHLNDFADMAYDMAYAMKKEG